MPALTKYEFLINELTSLEKQVYMYVQKTQGLINANNELKKKINQLEKENKELKSKVDEENTGDKLGLFNGKDLSDEDREKLKLKISELINKLDFHLRS